MNLAFGEGYNRFMQSSGDWAEDDTPEWSSPPQPSEPFSLSCTATSSDTLRNLHELQEQLGLALANTILLQSRPTDKAPTLRLAVDALRFS